MRNIENIIADLEQQRSAIDRAISALRDIGTGKAAGKGLRVGSEKAPVKRRLSPEGKRRIAEAARRRWANQRAAQALAAAAPKKRGRRKAAAAGEA